MTCKDCERCKAMGYKFCIKCGQSFMDGSPAPEYQSEPERKKRNIATLPLLAMLFVLTEVILTVAMTLLHFTDVLDFLVDKTFKVYLFIPVEVDIVVLQGAAIKAFWVFVAACMIAASAMIIWKSKDMFMIRDTDHYVERADKTPIYWVGLVLCGSIIVELVITLILTAFMHVSSPIDPSEWGIGQSLFTFGQAAVWEEIVFRLVLFGVPMMVAALICRQKNPLKYLLGGFGSSKLAIILLVISSVIFAYAHVGGWGLWKMIPTVIGGVAFGYLFMRFGLYASIIAHMVNDFLTVWLLIDSGLGVTLSLWFMIACVLCLYPLFLKTIKGIRKVKTLPNTGFEQEREDDQSS